jgi:hypothetical protein
MSKRLVSIGVSQRSCARGCNIPQSVIARSVIAWFVAAALLSATPSWAEDKEPTAIFEIGGAGEWAINGGSGFGPTAAVEFTPIKDWLEIEAGVTSLFSRGQTEWDTGFTFKKPFDLSPTVEFEPGIGPAWVHTIGGGKTTDALAAEAAFEFMFWPAKERKFGWFLEPSYSYSFGRDHEQALGVSVGLLIAIP